MVQTRTTRWMLIALLLSGQASAQEPVETLSPLIVPTAGESLPLELPKLLPPLVVRLAPEPASASTGIPITLDTVLRLAQDQNGQVRLARARLEEACSKNEIADRAWMPEVSVGPSYNRHEGGIQDFQGRNIHSSYGAVFGGVEIRGKLDLREVAFRRVEAERNLVQKRGEISRLSSEQLLDAATTYVDLLAAQSAITIM